MTSLKFSTLKLTSLQCTFLFAAMALMAGCSGGNSSSTSTGTGTGTTTSNVAAYVFTPVSSTNSTTTTSSTMEFALLKTGELQATTVTVPASLPVATAQGVVFPLPGSNGSLQSYALAADGSLQAQGSPATYSVDQFSTLVSDVTYVYAVSDEGIFGFQDQSSGLTPLSPVQQLVASPCTAAQENLNECTYKAQMTLSTGGAFLMQEGSNPTSGNGPTFISGSFTRTQGQLTAETSIPEIQTFIPFTSTPNGSFVYYQEQVTGNLILYNSATQSATANILADGSPVVTLFGQLNVSVDGKYLFAPSYGTPAQISVFSIDQSSGNLTEVAGSPFSTTESNLVAVTLDPTGGFLLAVHSYCLQQGTSSCTTPGKLVAMSIDSSTGALAVTSDVDDAVFPLNVAAAPISQ